MGHVMSEMDISDMADVEEIRLSEAEQQKVEELSQKIDLRDSSFILQYGAACQKKVAAFADSALERACSDAFDGTDEMLTALVSELKDFSAADEAKGGLFGIFKKNRDKAARMKACYSQVEANIDRITAELEGYQNQLLTDIVMLNKMYEANLQYYKELTIYITAGRKALEKGRSETLPAMQEKAGISKQALDVQAANDFEAMCEQFDKRLYDLELTQAVSMQTAPQIRMMRGNDILITEKIQSAISNTIPLWKSQMVIALDMAHSKQNMEIHKKASDLNGDLLGSTNEQLIDALAEVMRVKGEAGQRRKAVESELMRIEAELKAD